MDSSSSSSSIPVEAIKAYHASERRLYARMVLDASLDPFRAMEIISFWLWLAEIGHPDIICHAQSLSPVALLLLAGVAEAFIDALRLEPTDSFRPNADLRLSAIHGITYYLSSVCFKAFDDIQRQADELRLDRLMLQFSNVYLDQASSSSSPPRMQDMQRAINFRQQLNLLFETPIDSGLANLHSQSHSLRHSTTSGHQMNYTAQPYHPLSMINSSSSSGSPPPAHNRHDMSRDDRTLFVTFSNGYPLTEEDLYVFFMSRYGDVESVSVQTVTKPGTGPLFARVSFNHEETMLKVLNGNVKAKFMFKGKHLWARRFTTMYKRR
ncbi:hypothetical protein J5N97_012486 [Dioscorea zingiberensis]|uniref:RRM domain-containing protein n=1 Tax=Dioscorea zingiberensis TaxID=325984 RepID=A0A9D5HI51_9LILI|nr:hypothetical protein J5N97_012486 [Dioscorea zingiberensis]